MLSIWSALGAVRWRTQLTIKIEIGARSCSMVPTAAEEYWMQ